jgi:hypothetical protein
LDKLSSVTSSYVTPKKFKVGFLLEAFADSIPIGLGKAAELTALPDLSELVDDPLKQAQAEAMEVILAEWNTLRRNFETFNDEFSKLGEGEKKYRDAISETVMKIHDAIRDTDARTSLMVAQLGHDQMEASSLGTDSVWNLMRQRMLAWWKQKVTRSFLCWLGVRLDAMADADACWINSISQQDRVYQASTSRCSVTCKQENYE